MKLIKTIGKIGIALAVLYPSAKADITFSHIIEGTPLDLSVAKSADASKSIEADAFDRFKQSGSNPYNCNSRAVEAGYSLFLSACSGCHGHEAEGKLGPGLADDYWTYPQNATDKGLFETLFGGAQGMMGPQYVNLSNDEMLQIMAWLRSVYQGKPKKAKWLRHPDRCNKTSPHASKPQVSN